MAFSLLLFALQGDLRIEKIERLAGNVYRPVLWSPLSVTVSSTSGYQGELSARSYYGFSVAVDVDLKPGAAATVLLPAIAPEEVYAGSTRVPMAKDFVSPEHVVLVDARLRYAADLVSTEKILFRPISPEDLKETLPRGLLEAAHLILVGEGAGLGIGAAPAAVVAPTREEAERAIQALPRNTSTVEVVEDRIAAASQGGGWVPAKKTTLIYLAGVYALAIFLSLGVLAKRFPRAALGAAVGAIGLSVAAYALWFPRKHVWVEERGIEVVREDGQAGEWRVWFAGSSIDLTTRIEFPRLVKPVFTGSAGAEEHFTLKVGRRGSSAEGLRLLPGRTACFAGVASSEPAAVRRPLYDAVRVSGGEARFRGDLPQGGDLRLFDPQGPRPLDSGFEVWRRFIGNDGIYGILDRRVHPAGKVTSPHLADAREGTGIYIERFK